MDKQDKKDGVEKLDLFINKIEEMCDSLCESEKKDEVLVWILAIHPLR